MEVHKWPSYQHVHMCVVVVVVFYLAEICTYELY